MRYVTVICAALVALLLAASTSYAQEVAAFRLTDLSSYLELTYRDDRENSLSTGVETNVDDTRRQIEFGVTTTSYIFHPKLVQMHVAGSLLSDEQELTRRQALISRQDIDELLLEREGLLLNLNTRFLFLKDKAYPTTISYMRENPVVNTGTEGSFTQETERFGVDFRLLDVLPLNLFVNTSRDSSFGESLDRIVDQNNERFSVRARKSFSRGNRFQVDYEAADQESRNGDKRRPIRESASRTERLLFASNSLLGSKGQFSIDQSTSIFRRDDPDATDLRFSPRFSWTHTSALQSQYRYALSRSDRKDSGLENTSESMSASLRYSPSDRFNGLLRANVDRTSEADRLSQNSRGLFGQANVRHATSLGRLSLSAGLGYRLEDRDARSPRVFVEEEPVTFSGAAPVALSREFVVVDTVVVRNETRTQTYIEGVDYLLTELGSQIRIERLISGSILDGETVLIDYEAQTGGTFEYSQFDQTIGADFRFARYHSVFFRYVNKRQELRSGISTLPFNSVEGIEVGLRERVPLRWAGIQLSAEARYRRQNEDINPFNQTSLSLSLQAPLAKRLNFHVSASRSVVENLLSEEDSDLTAVAANLTWQAWRNLTIQANGNHDEDTGGTVLRSNTRWRMTAQWRYRRILLRMDARYSRQRQGDLESDHYELWLKIRRELF